MVLWGKDQGKMLDNASKKTMLENGPKRVHEVRNELEKREGSWSSIINSINGTVSSRVPTAQRWGNKIEQGKKILTGPSLVVRMGPRGKKKTH